MSTAHVHCPFPPCTGEWWVGVGPGAAFVSVPLHPPEGGFEGHDWYAIRCPGALGLIDPITGEMNVRTADVVNRAYEKYLSQLITKRERQERDAEAEPGRSVPHIGFNVGRAPNLSQNGTEMYFPGRPADAPEPGPGEAPAQPVEIGQGYHLGRAAMDNAHDTTRGLTQLALDKHREARGKLIGLVHALNGATGIATMAEIEATAAAALVTAAVGTGAGKPEPAERMAEQTALAVDTIMGPDGNIFNAIEVAKIKVTAAIQQLDSAIENGERYIALLS